ncbi:cysteine hydrolase family protein [Arthrobacter mobilis]|uniref:Cysteine hydrolase n=1 Tax=Arthrobacter mobilis TaxID=2724944 RepID=A0A7X6HF01_9MICC|nr:isochorismatase family cysteine hydrolase [Arthrobacter mobilis]NKX55816.1 cysteine hydrolase [Arthrobacter mobilis]
MGLAVLIIDMQKGYFEDPVLARRQEQLVAGCNELIAQARGAGVPVLLPCTEHQRDKSTWTLNMLEDDQGFAFAGSETAEIVPGLEAAGLPRLPKTRDSAFIATDLLFRLRNLRVETLVLAGVSSHNCIAQTGVDAFAHNFRVVYARDAMASTNEEFAEQMLTILCKEYRQEVAGAEAVKMLLTSGNASH